MKPFDPKTAKNGDKVCHYSIGPFYTYVGPYPKDFTSSVVLDCNNNLMFLDNSFLYCRPTKRTVWINLIKYHPGDAMSYAYVYDTEYQAKEELKSYTGTCIGTYPLEIEE